MKKIILFLTIVLIVSCNNEQSKEQIKPEYPKPFSLIINGNVSICNGIFLGSDKHEYLVINSHNINHYIDCKLCQSRKTSK